MSAAVADKAKSKTTAPAVPIVEPLFEKQFRAARLTSTPLVMIGSTDPAATMERVRSMKKRSGEPLYTEKMPMVQWDAVRGLIGLNDEGKAAVAVVKDAHLAVNPVAALKVAEVFPAKTTLFMMNLHRFIDNPQVLQALWNLRDVYKADQRMVVGLGIAFKIPAEIAGDVVLIDEPLPTRTELEPIINKQHENAGLTSPTDQELRSQVLDAIVGLPQYTAESVVAMSLSRQGVDVPMLWERKIKAIENNDGMRVWRGKENIDDLKGLSAVKGFAEKLIAAQAFGAIVFMDEVEKAMAGGMSDYVGDSGVSKDQVGVLLSYIEDTKSMGVLFAGLAGCGKTQLAKAMAHAAGKPLIMFDLGAMKGGTVGSSERSIRNNLKVVTAVAEGRVLFLATANKTASFSPEWNRRFADQFFYDVLPDSAHPPVWDVYVKQNSLTAAQARIPKGFDAGWTGAEIRRVCERAALFNCTVVDAAKYLVPMVVSAKDTIADLRQQAHGHFLSASYDGWYVGPQVDPKEQAKIAREAVQREIEIE